eukprot:1625910-Pyramimonas_sp.AAC.1
MSHFVCDVGSRSRETSAPPGGCCAALGASRLKCDQARSSRMKKKGCPFRGRPPSSLPPES